MVCHISESTVTVLACTCYILLYLDDIYRHLLGHHKMMVVSISNQANLYSEFSGIARLQPSNEVETSKPGDVMRWKSSTMES